MTEGKRGFDLGTLLMVLVLLCILVAGLWMTGKALDSRFDELNRRLTTLTEQIEGDITNLRSELRAAHATEGKAAPAPAKKAAAEKPAE
jgi:hypothetical protein